MSHFEQLDIFDLKILKELGADGRLSWRELADKIGLSLSPTIRRIRRLEGAGIIKGYHASIDQGHLRDTIGVFTTVGLEKQARSSFEQFELTVRSMPEVIGGYQISGGSDYLVHAMVEGLPHYQKLLNKLSGLDGVARIQSNFVVKTFVQRHTSTPFEHM